MITFAVKKYLIHRGYDAQSANELEEAQALLANVEYDLVIVDLRLSGTSGAEGFDLIDYIRERYPRTRIILLTAHYSTQVERRALVQGASVVLQKPVLLPEIADTIHGLLEVRA